MNKILDVIIYCITSTAISACASTSPSTPPVLSTAGLKCDTRETRDSDRRQIFVIFSSGWFLTVYGDGRGFYHYGDGEPSSDFPAGTYDYNWLRTTIIRHFTVSSSDIHGSFASSSIIENKLDDIKDYYANDPKLMIELFEIAHRKRSTAEIDRLLLENPIVPPAR